MTISALNEDGNPVDWWFAYKLPKLPLGPAPDAEYKRMTAEERKEYDEARTRSQGNTQGTEYLYCDAASPALPKALSSHDMIPANILETGALVNTIQQLRDAAARQDPQVGWIFYNDEHLKVKKESVQQDNFDFGHTKGVLAFDLETNTAFWMLHSWPCYPSIPAVDPPSSLFGQTFLCITLRDVATADMIAGMFRDQSQPQIIGIHLPEAFDSKMYPNLLQLVNNTVYTSVPLGSSQPRNITFNSKNGTEFRLFAKSKDWMAPAKDLYSDYIGPTLGVDLEVETWQTGETDHDSDGTHTTQDIQWIDLSALGLNYAWNFRFHDHSKWAVSKDPDTQDETDWVIVADINRVDTQYKRGGVGIAFQNRELAHSLHSILQMVLPPPDAKPIEDLLDTMLRSGQSTTDIPMPPEEAGNDPASPMVAQ